MNSKRKVPSIALAVCVLWIAVCGVVAAKIVTPRTSRELESSNTYTGAVKITSSSDGKWAFVSVASTKKGEPLVAAYVIQFGEPLNKSIAYTGDAVLQADKYILQVVGNSGAGLIFKLSKYQGSVPSNSTTVPGVVGIARYDATGTSVSGRFLTHELFVSTIGGRLGHSRSLTCTDGGQGASSCSIAGNGGCSVGCDSGYYACCNVGSCTCVSQSEFN